MSNSASLSLPGVTGAPEARPALSRPLPGNTGAPALMPPNAAPALGRSVAADTLYTGTRRQRPGLLAARNSPDTGNSTTSAGGSTPPLRRRAASVDQSVSGGLAPSGMRRDQPGAKRDRAPAADPARALAPPDPAADARASSCRYAVTSPEHSGQFSRWAASSDVGDSSASAASRSACRCSMTFLSTFRSHLYQVRQKTTQLCARLEQL